MIVPDCAHRQRHQEGLAVSCEQAKRDLGKRLEIEARRRTGGRKINGRARVTAHSAAAEATCSRLQRPDRKIAAEQQPSAAAEDGTPSARLNGGVAHDFNFKNMPHRHHDDRHGLPGKRRRRPSVLAAIARLITRGGAAWRRSNRDTCLPLRAGSRCRPRPRKSTHCGMGPQRLMKGTRPRQRGIPGGNRSGLDGDLCARW